MSHRPARTALATALDDRRRHALALALVLLTVGVAALLGSAVGWYAAGLVVFTVWMVWFVLTGIAFLRNADF